MWVSGGLCQGAGRCELITLAAAYSICLVCDVAPTELSCFVVWEATNIPALRASKNQVRTLLGLANDCCSILQTTENPKQ